MDFYPWLYFNIASPLDGCYIIRGISEQQVQSCPQGILDKYQSLFPQSFVRISYQRFIVG